MCLKSPSLVKKDCVFECFFALVNVQCVGLSNGKICHIMVLMSIATVAGFGVAHCNGHF